MNTNKTEKDTRKPRTLREQFSDEHLIKIGVQPPYVNIDKSVFIKTPEEKQKLKAAKAAYKHNSQLVMV